MESTDHYIERCVHGIVVSQCRCPGPRTEYVTDCPEGCRIAALESQLAEAERTIAELRAELLAEQTRSPGLRSERDELLRERDEARRVAVWAVRNQVEALGVPPQVDIFVFGRHRTRCDGTPAGIIDALHRVRAAERLVELI